MLRSISSLREFISERYWSRAEPNPVTSFTDGLFTTLVARLANMSVLRVSDALSTDGDMVQITAVFAFPPETAHSIPQLLAEESDIDCTLRVVPQHDGPTK